MKMDKKTMLVVVGCLIALFGWQTAINRIYPPKPKPLRPATVAVTNAPAQTEAAKPAEKPVGPAKATTETVAEPTEPRPAEQTVTLRNEYVHMVFTSWGGGVWSVELLKHKANDSSNVVLNGQVFVPALTLSGVTDAGSNAVFAIEQPAPDTVVMKRRTKDGLDITK